MYDYVQHLCRKLRGLIKRAYVSRSNDDSGPYPITQVTFFGDKTGDAERISPYGLYCNLPEKTPVLLFSVNSQAENKAVIGYTQNDRFKDLLPGEVVVGNITTGTFIKFDNDGNIEIQGDADISIKATNVKVEAIKVDLGVGGSNIARLGDAVAVDTGTGIGTITSAGINTSL